MARIKCAEREVAKANNGKTYSTGKPCKRGHISERFVSTYTCVECSRMELYQTERERYRTSENTLAYQLRQRKVSANKLGIPFNILLEDIEQPEYCPVLGIKLNYAWGGKEGHLRDPSKATIDKVVPNLGYVLGNVFVISWRANKLKSDMTIVELEKIMNYIKEKTHDQTI
jgi:hypothetical protein